MVVKKDPLVWELTYSDLHILEHQKLVSLLAIYETDLQFEFFEKVSTENWWPLCSMLTLTERNYEHTDIRIIQCFSLIVLSNFVIPSTVFLVLV